MQHPLAYYNEVDEFAAAWLKNLIAAGLIAHGVVDTRDIRDVRPADLAGFTQCHFFAGIGVWSYSLRRAGWPDSRSVWTGSCPCQPFSAAGRGGGFADERHLWPHWHHLIAQCRPAIVLGEQVASKDGLGWLDLVQSDMEGTNYAFGAVDTCSAGSGAPHIRQRLRFVAELADARSERVRTSGRVEDRDAARGNEGPSREWERLRSNVGSSGAGASRILADADDTRSQGRCGVPERPDQCAVGPLGVVSHEPTTGPTNGFWRDADWLYCRDGKWRPVEPGTFPLAHGASSRVGRLRAFGNAIDAEATHHFIEAYLDCLPSPVLIAPPPY